MSHLLPNLGGPSAYVRRLYVNVVQSVILYGSPVWAREMAGNGRIKRLVTPVQRKLATRVFRAYLTASHAAVTALAGTSPIPLIANERAEIYWNIRRMRERNNSPPREPLAY